MKKIRLNMYLDISYIMILAASFGAVIVLGVIVAPIVFHTQELSHLSSALNHFSAGVVMAEIFNRFTFWLYLLLALVLFFEGRAYKEGQRDTITLISAFVTTSTILLFNVIYTPRILSLQSIGESATQSETFNNLHLASEFDFKLLALALLVLFFRKVMLMRTIK